MMTSTARRLWPSLLTACAWLSVISGFARAQGEQQALSVSQVVNGIISYTRWPNELPSSDSLEICLVGEVEHADYLGYHSAMINGRRMLMQPRTAAELPATCAVVYAGIIEQAERDTLTRNLIGRPVLVISEHSSSCDVASMICLSVAEKRAAFEINLDALARSGIRIHPSVLRLARP